MLSTGYRAGRLLVQAEGIDEIHWVVIKVGVFIDFAEDLVFTQKASGRGIVVSGATTLRSFLCKVGHAPLEIVL